MGFAIWFSNFVVVGMALYFLLKELDIFREGLLNLIQKRFLSSWQAGRTRAFQMCWEPLSLLVCIFGFGLLFLNLNSSWVLLLAAIFWILRQYMEITFQRGFLFVLGWGLLLWSSEMALRSGGMVLQQAEEFPVIFYFSESGVRALLLALVAGALIGLLARIPLLAAMIGLSLIMIGSASLVFVFGLWIGENGVRHLFVRKKSEDHKWRALGFYVLAVMVAVLFPVVRASLESLWPGAYQPDLRFVQAIGLLIFMILAEILSSSVILHLRYKFRLKS